MKNVTPKPDDIRGEFTIVAVPGTHRENSQRRRTKRRALPKADKQRVLLDARRAGLSWREAAKRAGYRSVGSAYQAAQEAIAAIPREAAEEVRQIELERLDAIVHANWHNMESGDPEAGHLILRTIERRAKLLGLDQVTMPEVAYIDARVQAMIFELQGMTADELQAKTDELDRLIDASERDAAAAKRGERTDARRAVPA